MPAGTAHTANGSHFARPTTPAFDGEPVKVSISSGNATVDTCEPSSETASPPHKSM